MPRKPSRDPLGREPLNQPLHDEPLSEEAAIEDIDRILARLDAEIPEAKKEMDALLARLRTTRILSAA